MTTTSWRIDGWLGRTRSSRIARAAVAGETGVVLLRVAHAGADGDFRREHARTHGLAAPGFAAPQALIEGADGLAAVIGRLGPVPLVSELDDRPRDWREVLRLMLPLVRGLSAWHAIGLTHSDLRPCNLLIDLRAQALLIADASAAAPPGPASAVGNGADGADRDHPGDPWAYLAPEQTGRLEREVDARSDLYVLGVLMYRLLAGRLPFDAADPLEWAHAHLARVPVPLGDIVPGTPAVVDHLVAKLLAKSPEDRYQSGAGLLADLERCLRGADEQGRVADFALGAADEAGRLELPTSLIGRERELAALDGAFERALAESRCELVLISGAAGAGKTSLARHLCARVLAAGGRVIEGKYDEEQRGVPHSALIRALDARVRPMLAGSEPEVEAWRRRWLELLGVNAGLAAAVVPALGLLLGPVDPPPPLDARDAQRRLHLVLGRIVGEFARTDAPLLLLLDDLHAADPGSLVLLESLWASLPPAAMLVVATSRTQGDQLPPRLTALLETLRAEQLPLVTVELDTWTAPQVAAAIAEMLGREPKALAPLAEQVHRRTGGNPLFTVEFLRELQAEGLLRFDAARGEWQWDAPAIAAKGYAGNVVALMLQRLRRLSPEAQGLLRQAACFGSVATTALLAAASPLTPAQRHEALREALDASLVRLDGDRLAFAHDRVREAAYELIPADERAAMHLQAGRLLLARLTPAQQDENLFDIAHQFQQGAALLAGDEAALAWSLILRAGRKAQAAGAFASARHHFVVAQRLQPDDAWDATHDQAMDLALGLAECEAVAGEAMAGEQALDLALAHALSDLERVRIHRARSRLRLFDSRYHEALDAALAALRLLGLQVPDDDATLPAALVQARGALETALAGRSADDLLALPLAHEPAALATLELLAGAFFPARSCRPALFQWLVVKAVTLSLQHGHSVPSCQAYALYPRLLRGEGRLGEAYAFSVLSLRQADKLGAVGLKGSLSFSHFASSYFLRHPYASGVAPLHEAFQASLQAGSIYDAAACVLVASEYLFESAASLDELVHRASGYVPSLRQGVAGVWTLMARSWIQFARALQGRTSAPDRLDGDGFTEHEYELAIERSGALSLRAIYLVHKQIVAWATGQYTRSLTLADEAARLLAPLAGMAIELTQRHYRALAIAALAGQGMPAGEAQAQLAAEHHALGPLADACPANFRHRWLLLGAELARLRGEVDDTSRMYLQAIEAAHRHGFVAHEAQAFERAASWHESQGQPSIARAFLAQARERYRRWGGMTRIDALDAAHAGLADAPAPARASIDTLAVAKASQALSSLIELDALLDALMRIALDHAGAQTALLFLAEGPALQLVAAAEVEGHEVRVRLERVPEGARALPRSVVNYVQRTRELVLVPDASAASHPFTADAYLQQARPRSLMALPLLRMANLVGVLYLDHRLSAHAFPRERVAVLEMLASQAAISLETARLYAELRHENAERQRAQQAALERQARLERLVASSLVGIRFANLAGQVLDANDAFLRIVGYTRADLAAGRLRRDALTPPEYREVDARARAEMRRDGRCTPYEKEYRRKDGTRVPVLVGGVLFDDAEPQTVAFVLDLTQHHQALADREARVAAEAASQAKSAFLASMSHELRTPLNGVLGYAQLLQMGEGLSPKQQRAVSMIETSGRHLLALINDILDLARIEAGRLELAHDRVELRPLLDVVADTVRPVAQRKGLEFRLGLADDLPDAVQTDARRLSQVLLNLLGNAAKFTDAGAVSLRARAEPQGDAQVQLNFEVEDTGVGMTAAELQRIFQPFEQVGAARRRAEGTGLGLAITEALVRQMGGRLTVRSEPGRGSSFALSLVLPRLAPAKVVVPRGRIAGYQGPRRTVLVADDVPESRAFLVDLLGTLGFSTFEAADGLQALAQARAKQPDLILMDNGMPSMTGLDATRQLRADPAFAATPIIAVSAGVSEAERQRCLSAGASVFLAKPVDVHDLLQAIGRVLGLEWTAQADA